MCCVIHPHLAASSIGDGSSASRSSSEAGSSAMLMFTELMKDSTALKKKEYYVCVISLL